MRTPLLLIGILLLGLGTLNIMGYIDFQIVEEDITPPEIIYMYPQSGKIYKSADVNELVVYAQEPETEVTSVYYTDSYNTVPIYLQPTLHEDLIHPLTVYFKGIECKFPDVDKDTKVTDADVDAIGERFGAKVGDPLYDSTYDVFPIVPDGVINIDDVGLVGKFKGTAVFATTFFPNYPIEATNITFSFVAVNNVGLASDFSGSFEIGDYAYLDGTWYINNITINDFSLIYLEEYEITISFNCTDRTIPETAITVEATINDITYKLNKVNFYYWQSPSIQLKQGTNEINLIAYSIDYASVNQVAVIIETPEAFTFTSGHLLIVMGIICIISAVAVEKKHETVW
jgi:hypothetical protein